MGGSSTGKTRAAFEAVRTVLPDWLLFRPEDAAELLSCLRSDAVGPRAVLWLNELVSTLLAREPAAHVALDHLSGVPTLVWALRDVGAAQAVSALVARADNAGLWQWSLDAYPGKARQYKFGRQPDGTASKPWRWQDLTD